jgi:hypothetical protein
MGQAPTADPQVDFLAGLMVDLAKRVKADRLYGTFAVEFSAHDGEIRTTTDKLEITRKPPASGMTK